MSPLAPALTANSGRLPPPPPMPPPRPANPPPTPPPAPDATPTPAAEAAPTAEARAAARADEEQVVAGHGTRLAHAVHAAQLPQHLARGRVVRAHLAAAQADHLRPVLGLPDQRRAPARSLR